MARLQKPFGPLEVGEVDNVLFDLTGDVGQATIISASWTCSMAPIQPDPSLIDPTPQARVLSVQPATFVYVRSPIDGIVSRKDGAYVVAQIGGCPASFAGGTYV